MRLEIGGGIWTVLLAVFVTLKLVGQTEVASWSWWWVLSPLWIPVAVMTAFGVFCLAAAAVAAALSR